jgi:hypothetical protein
MSNLLQTVIPAAATFLVGYQGALTRTSRLCKSIPADMDMLDALPEGHPSRATLTTHIEELIDTLVRREARQFEPIIPVGTSFGVHAALTVVMVLAVLILGLEEPGLYHPDPPNWTSPRWPDTVAMRPGVTVAGGRDGAAVPTPAAADSRLRSAGVVGCTRRSSGRSRLAPGRGCGSGGGRPARP